MPQQRPASVGRRGPLAREPRLKPSGFRISERTRFELQAAALYTGCTTIQAVLEIAVTEFLERMASEDGFRETLAKAEAAQRRRAGIPSVDRRG